MLVRAALTLVALSWAVLSWAAPAEARDPGLLMPFPTASTPERLSLRGRFVEDEGFRAPSRHRSKARNVFHNLRQLDADEIEHARVELRVDGQRFEARTDDDGVWQLDAEASPALSPGRHVVGVHAIDDKGHPTPDAQGFVYVIPPNPGVAVISDFDDTVVHSNITSTRKMIKTALSRNAAQLTPVAGAAATYSAWREAGAVATFYVSGSPQNFMPRVLDFLRLNAFPDGPVRLKNFGEDPTLDQERYKRDCLQAILAAHPNLRFLLVGDAGERDPEIYAHLRGQFPDRVVGIIIRRTPKSDVSAARLAGMVVVDDFTDTARLTALLTPRTTE